MIVAREMMSQEVITVSLETTVEELAKLLYQHNIGGVPVVDGTGELLGVVTESDLIDQSKKIHIPTMVSFLDSVIFLESARNLEKELKKMTGATVADIYSASPQSIGEETTLEEIATIMAEHQVHTLPVLKDGKIVGVVGKGDLIKMLAR